MLGLALLALAGCSNPPAAQVAVPRGPGQGCHRLFPDLPGRLDGRDRRDTSPGSDRTAAWGHPAVTLRCGVSRPDGLTATSEVIAVDGVEWYLTEPSPPYVFTTVGRGSYVQVRVPAAVPRGEATAPLVDLAAPLKKAFPRQGD